MSIEKLISDIENSLSLEDFMADLFTYEEKESFGLDDNSADIKILEVFLRKKYNVTNFNAKYVTQDNEYYHTGDFVFDGSKYKFGFFPAGGIFWAQK